MKVYLILLLTALLNLGCEPDFSDQFAYNPPESINDGLNVGTLAEVGLDSQMILNIVGRIRKGKYRELPSMLIYKDGKLVFEKYYPGYKYKWDGISGLQWNEWGPHGTSANDIDRIYFECSEDPISCILELPMEDKPGSSFTYNGGGIIVLGEILKNASGLRIDSFAKQYLFEPLGIVSASWYVFDNGSIAS
jgi:hypothetical protein